MKHLRLCSFVVTYYIEHATERGKRRDTGRAATTRIGETVGNGMDPSQVVTNFKSPTKKLLYRYDDDYKLKLDVDSI